MRGLRHLSRIRSRDVRRMDEKFWYLKSCCLFEQLTSEQISRLELRSKSRCFDRGELIYVPAQEAESVLLLVSGRVKIYTLTAEGKQAVLAFIEPGELFGELTLFTGGPRDEFAEAMDPVAVVWIPGEQMQRLMEEHSAFALGITKLIGLRRRRIERRLKSLLFRSNRERLIHLLLELAEQYGRQTPKGVLLGIRLSHQELSSVIGSTRESVTVLLGELQAEGYLRVSRRQITLRDPACLAASIQVALPQLQPEISQPIRPLPSR